MIEIHINKDVGSYEAKFIGPLTIRQTICVAIAAPICWWIYQAAAPVISVDAAGFLMLFPAVIAWVFGWTKPYGMRPEKFVRSVFINMVMAPSNRKYKSTNRSDVYSPELSSGKLQGAGEAGETSDQSDLHEDSEDAAAQDDVSTENAHSGSAEGFQGEKGGSKKKKQPKKPRYRVSPDAVK